MRQALTAILSIAIVSVLVGAGTYAYFSDTETSTGNIFTSGTFDIDISTGNSLPLQAANIFPGWDKNTDSDEFPAVTTHGVRNLGSLAGEVYITADNFVEPFDSDDGYFVEYDEPSGGIEVGPKDFADVLYIKVFADLNGDYDFTDVGEDIYVGSLRDLNTARFSIDPSQFINCKFEAYMPLDLDDTDNTSEDTFGGIPDDGSGNEDDNAYQADGVLAEIIFHGTTEITLEQ